MKRAWRTAILTWAAAAAVATAAEPSVDQRFLSGLRERGLYALAESYCTSELRRPNLAPERQAELTVELSRTLAVWATVLTPTARTPLWQRSADVVEQFAQRQPKYPDLIAVRLQGVLGSLVVRGELLRLEAEFPAQNGPLLDEARAALRQAIRALRELAGQLDVQLRAAGASTRQGLALRQRLAYHLARALCEQGECYAPGSPDLTSSLSEAAQLLEPLAVAEGGDPLVWRSRVELVRVERLLGRSESALRRLRTFQGQLPPPDAVLRLRAEELRLALAAGSSAGLERLLAEPREQEGQISAALDLARFEAQWSLWRTAAPADAKRRQTLTGQAFSVLDRNHGPYWQRIARKLLAEFVLSRPEGGDRDLLVLAAETAYRAGRYDTALAAYDRARAEARKEADRRAEFQLAYLGAAIEHQQGRHAEALTRFRDAARAASEDPRAPEAFALAVYHAAQLARDESPTAITEYEALLKEYLTHWPQASGSGRIRGQLGRLLELQDDWPAAIAVWRKMPANDPLFGTAVSAVVRCYERWIAREQRLGEPTAAIAAEAAAWIDSVRATPATRVISPSP